MTGYTDAIGWAAELHSEAQRKYWPAPLLAHLVAVSSLVWEDGGDEEQAIGALLHDALVYGNCSLDDLESRFGGRVAAIARFASDTREVFEAPPRPAWLERRQSHTSPGCVAGDGGRQSAGMPRMESAARSAASDL